MTQPWNANTSVPCCTCQQLRCVTITEGVKVNGKWRTWVVCVPCWLAEARGDR